METQIYEIINPSDKYTIKGDLKTTALATVMLGRGAYGLHTQKGETAMPIFLFGDPDTWFIEQFGQTLQQVSDTTDDSILADVFDSVLIGGFKERHTYELGLSLIEGEEKREQWWSAWHEARRSSMNDIGGAAHNYAKKLREYISRKQEEQPHEPQH